MKRFWGSGREKCLGHPRDLDLMSRSCGSTLHEGRANGEVDDKVRRSESRSDEQLIQLSVLTRYSLASYTTIQATGLPVRIDQEVEMTDRSEENSPYIHEYSRAGCTIT